MEDPSVTIPIEEPQVEDEGSASEVNDISYEDLVNDSLDGNLSLFKAYDLEDVISPLRRPRSFIFHHLPKSLHTGI